jgi:hypothetical protein
MTHDHDLSRAAWPAVLTASDAVAASGARFHVGTGLRPPGAHTFLGAFLIRFVLRELVHALVR